MLNVNGKIHKTYPLKSRHRSSSSVCFDRESETNPWLAKIVSHEKLLGKSQKTSFWLGKTMWNTNSGWHLQVLNLRLAGTEERIFFPTEVKY